LSLGWIYSFFYYNYDVSNQILELEIDKFPNSPLILYACGYVLRKQGNLEQSTEQFKKAKDGMSEISEFQTKIDYEIGSNHFVLREWNQAVIYLTKFIENYTAESFRTYCAYQIGFCYILLGDKNKATRYMKMVEPWVRKNYALDEYADFQAKKYLKGAFSPFEILYQQALLCHEANNFIAALDFLDKAKPEEKTIGDTARTYQLRGSVLAHLKRFEEAKANYMEVIKEEKQVQKSGRNVYALPFSCCGLTEIAIVENDLTTGITMLKKTKKYSNYEFETFLTWRIRKCEDDLLHLKNRS